MPTVSAAQVSANPQPALPAEQVSSGLAVDRRLLRSGLWVMCFRAIGIGSMVLMNVLLARRLSLESFGAFVVARSMASPLAIVAMLGWNSALLRFLAERLGMRDPDGARHYLKMSCLSVAVASTALLIFTAGPPGKLLAQWLQLPDVDTVAPLVGAWMFLSAWHQFLAEGLRGCHEQRFATLIGGEMGGPLSNSLFCLVLLVSAWLGPLTLTGCLAICVCIQALLLPLTLGLLGLTLRRRSTEVAAVAGTAAAATVHSRPSMMQLIGTVCVPLMIAGLLSCVIAQGDVWIAGVYCPKDDLALYAAARRLMLLVMTPLMLANLATLPTVAELFPQNKIQELQRVLQYTATLAGIPALAATLVLVVCPGPVLALVFGEPYRAGRNLVAILAVGQLVFVVSGVWSSALNMSGRHNEGLWINFVTAMALVVLGPWAADQHGALGLAIVSASLVGAQNILGWWRTKSVLGVWTHASPRCVLDWNRQWLLRRNRLAQQLPLNLSDVD